MTKCVEIGTALDYLMKKDVAMLYKEENKCSKGNLLSYDHEKWLNERPTEVVCLLRTFAEWIVQSSKSGGILFMVIEIQN